MLNIDDFWNNVKALLKAQNKTQRMFSCECGFAERRIENLITTNRSPDIIEAFKIAKALNTSVEYLVCGEESHPDVKELQELKTKYEALAMTIKGIASTL